jgi:hypothetical protein
MLFNLTYLELHLFVIPAIKVECSGADLRNKKTDRVMQEKEIENQKIKLKELKAKVATL